MKCWYDNNITCLADCELIENCQDRERMIEVERDAIREFAEWFDEDYETYQKCFEGYCKVKVSTTLRRFEKQKGWIKEQSE